MSLLLSSTVADLLTAASATDLSSSAGSIPTGMSAELLMTTSANGPPKPVGSSGPMVTARSAGVAAIANSSGLLPTTVLAMIAAALAVVLALPGRPARRRLAGRPGTPSLRKILPARLRPHAVPPAARRTHRLVAGVAAGGVLLAFGLPTGALLGGLILFAVPVALSRLEPASARRRSARIVADLPLAVDLLAACLRSGRPPDDAVGLVGEALGGPLAELLAKVQHRLGLGADPVDAWGVLLAEPVCAPVARAVQRALQSGAPLAKTLDHLADDVRQDRRWTAEERARAVETRSVVPLGLCFLPAFILIGVVPTIAGSLAGFLTVLGS